MLRLLIISAVCLSFIGAAMIPHMASATPKHSCCSPISDCAQGFQKKSCCLSSSETTPPSSFNSAELVSHTLNAGRSGLSVQPDLACDNKKSEDSDESPDDDHSLYLKNETFLI